MPHCPLCSIGFHTDFHRTPLVSSLLGLTRYLGFFGHKGNYKGKEIVLRTSSARRGTTSAHAVPNSTRRCERGFLTKQKTRVWVFCNYFLLFCLLLAVLCTDLLLPRLLWPDQAAPHHRCQRGARPSLSRWPEPPEH